MPPSPVSDTVVVDKRSLSAFLPGIQSDTVTPSIGSIDSFSLILKPVSICESAALAFFLGLNTFPVHARSEAIEIAAVRFEACCFLLLPSS